MRKLQEKRLPWYDYKENLIDDATVIELEKLAKQNDVPEELVRNLLLSVYQNKIILILKYLEMEWIDC